VVRAGKIGFPPGAALSGGAGLGALISQFEVIEPEGIGAPKFIKIYYPNGFDDNFLKIFNMLLSTQQFHCENETCLRITLTKETQETDFLLRWPFWRIISGIIFK
jgi:hypothetical protein